MGGKRRMAAGRSPRIRWLALLAVAALLLAATAYLRVWRSPGGSAASPAITTTAYGGSPQYFWVFLPRDSGYNVVVNLTRMHLEGYRLSSVERAVYSMLTTPHFLSLGRDNETLYSVFLLDFRSLQLLRLYMGAIGVDVQAYRASGPNASLGDLAAALASGRVDAWWIVAHAENLDAGTLADRAAGDGLRCWVRDGRLLVDPRDLESVSTLARRMGGDLAGLYDQYPALVYQPS